MGQATDNLKAALTAKGLRYVGIRGNPKAPVCFAGEAPGEHEDKLLLPFVGASGQLQDDMIKDAGIDSNDVWFTNPYKTRPPENVIQRIDELGIDRGLFITQFFEELNEYRPTIIVSCGRTPTNILCPETIPRRDSGEEQAGFGVWRGSLLISPHLNWPHYVIPVYHPAFLFREWSEKDISQFILAGKVKAEYDYWRQNGRLNPPPTRELIVEPNFKSLVDLLRECLSTSEVSVDIELLRRKVPYTISIALSPFRAFSFSFWNYLPAQLVEIWRLLDTILRFRRQIGQNYTSFDAHWLRVLGFNVNIDLVDDTLIGHHVLWPELSHKLEFQTMQYTREPYYKEEGKGWSRKEGLKRLMLYNCKDAAVTFEIMLEQRKEMKERSC